VAVVAWRFHHQLHLAHANSISRRDSASLCLIRKAIRPSSVCRSAILNLCRIACSPSQESISAVQNVTCRCGANPKASLWPLFSKLLLAPTVPGGSGHAACPVLFLAQFERIHHIIRPCDSRSSHPDRWTLRHRFSNMSKRFGPCPSVAGQIDGPSIAHGKCWLLLAWSWEP